MDYLDAIDKVLDKAATVKLRGYRVDVVTAARREFTRRGCCNSKLIDPIERILKECLQYWSPDQKRDIWLSTETGAECHRDFDTYDLGDIDMALEGELMYYLIEDLAPAGSSRHAPDTDE
jgi:hypothetical protein